MNLGGDLSARTDLHVHTEFSDGADRLDEVVAAAERAGLHTLVLTDHVRADSTYLPRYVAAVRAARRRTPVRLVCGVEAKILDPEGRLDLPADLTGVEHVAIADHRFPLPGGAVHPEEVRARLADGTLTAPAAHRLLVRATGRALARVPRGRSAHLAHLFSVLPKAGLDEGALSWELLAPLALACRKHGVAVELNEKWRCPGPRTAGRLARAGVRLGTGSDAHRAEDVGRFGWAGPALLSARARTGEEAPWTP